MILKQTDKGVNLRKISAATFLLLALMTVCSCENGGNPYIQEGPVYRVGLSVNSADGILGPGPLRNISVSGLSVHDPASYKYYFRALPQWAGSENAYGIISEFTLIENYTAGKELGYFSQGQWLFEIQVKKTESGPVIYTGSNKLYVNAPDTSVSVTVTRGGESELKSTVTVSGLTANRVAGSGDSVEIKYGLTSDHETPLGTVSLNAAAGSTATTAMFDAHSVTELNPGSYWFTFVYKNGIIPVGGASVSFTLDGGESVTLSGDLNYAVFQAALLTINGVSALDVSLSATNSNSEPVTQIERGNPVTFTCTANPSDGASYMWYVNGIYQSGAPGSVFEWLPTQEQFSNIACSVTQGTVSVSTGVNISVTN